MPEIGLISFVDKSKVKEKELVGRCYLEAGFKHVGFTKGGLWAFQLLPEEMPLPESPIGVTGFLAFTSSQDSSHFPPGS